MTTLESKIKAVKELQDEIDALYRIVRAKDCNLSNEAQDELLTKVSIKLRDREELIDDINAALAFAGLTTRRLK